MTRFEKLLKTRLREGGRIYKALANVGQKVGGQSSLNVMAALNAMVAATDGTYLEIGLLHGKTLCGAMVGNEDRTFVGVDNAPTDIPKDNVHKLFPEVDFHFHRMDFRHFFRDHANGWRSRVGAYFYDADHSLAGQRDGLRLAVESGILADEAYIAVDDYSWLDTKKAVEEFLAVHPEWEVVLEEEDDWNQRGWWNGLVVLYRNGRDDERPRKKGDKR